MTTSTQMTRAEARDALEANWRAWLYHFYGDSLRTASGEESEFAPHHVDFWEAFWSVQSGRLPRLAGATRNSIFCVWPRGHGKSTSIEMAVASAAARKTRRYALYVSASQDQADGHVTNIGALLTGDRFRYFYPEAGDRRVGAYGNPKAWRRNRLQTSSGFTV
ncbi:MAG: hypothetical protein WC211_03595, partial [Dehalococcoidia bacterium]